MELVECRTRYPVFPYSYGKEIKMKEYKRIPETMEEKFHTEMTTVFFSNTLKQTFISLYPNRVF